MGRPKLPQLDLKEIEEQAQFCDSEEEIALSLGVSYSTFRRQKARDKERFEQAIKTGKLRAKKFVIGKFMQKVREGELTAMIFYLKCKCGWSEKQVLDVTTREEVPEGATALYAKIKAAYAKED